VQGTIKHVQGTITRTSMRDLKDTQSQIYFQTIFQNFLKEY
jgi:hypothetical protein